MEINTSRLEQAVIDGMVKMIQSGSAVTIDYDKRIDCSAELLEAYKNINHEKVMHEVTELLEHELAKKIVDKITTEMGTDIKKLMENATVREDLRFMLRKNVEDFLNKIK
jgi:hypothetical protein